MAPPRRAARSSGHGTRRIAAATTSRSSGALRSSASTRRSIAAYWSWVRATMWSASTGGRRCLGLDRVVGDAGAERHLGRRREVDEVVVDQLVGTRIGAVAGVLVGVDDDEA